MPNDQKLKQLAAIAQLYEAVASPQERARQQQAALAAGMFQQQVEQQALAAFHQQQLAQQQAELAATQGFHESQLGLEREKLGAETKANEATTAENRRRSNAAVFGDIAHGQALPLNQLLQLAGTVDPAYANLGQQFQKEAVQQHVAQLLPAMKALKPEMRAQQLGALPPELRDPLQAQLGVAALASGGLPTSGPTQGQALSDAFAVAPTALANLISYPFAQFSAGWNTPAGAERVQSAPFWRFGAQNPWLMGTGLTQ